MNNLVSVICCYNDFSTYSRMVESINNQSLPFELIGVDNSNKQFSSAAEALNFGASISSSEVLVFIHQDIEITNDDFFQSLYDQIIEQTQIGDIVGVAGSKYPYKHNLSNVLHGMTSLELAGEKITELTECDTVDECLFAMRIDTWNDYRFNSENCPGWHLYAVDYCLHSRKNGHHAYVTQFGGVSHFSKGTVSYDYYKNLIDIAKIYKKDFSSVYTTCGKVKTNFVFRRYFMFRKFFGKCLHRVS